MLNALLYNWADRELLFVKHLVDQDSIVVCSYVAAPMNEGQISLRLLVSDGGLSRWIQQKAGRTILIAVVGSQDKRIGHRVQW